MGVLNGIISEVTKWLLGKVDKKLEKQASPYRIKVLTLYDRLCDIADFVTKYKDNYLNSLLWPPEFRKESLKGLTKYDWTIAYSRYSKYRFSSSQPLYITNTGYQGQDISSEVRDAVRIVDEIGRVIELESTQDKYFWDSIIQYLNDLKKSFDIINGICMDKKEFVKMIMAVKDIEKQFENISLLYGSIDELKNYINMKWPPQKS